MNNTTKKLNKLNYDLKLINKEINKIKFDIADKYNKIKFDQEIEKYISTYRPLINGATWNIRKLDIELEEYTNLFIYPFQDGEFREWVIETATAKQLEQLKHLYAQEAKIKSDIELESENIKETNPSNAKFNMLKKYFSMLEIKNYKPEVNSINYYKILSSKWESPLLELFQDKNTGQKQIKILEVLGIDNRKILDKLNIELNIGYVVSNKELEYLSSDKKIGVRSVFAIDWWNLKKLKREKQKLTVLYKGKEISLYEGSKDQIVYEDQNMRASTFIKKIMEGKI